MIQFIVDHVEFNAGSIISGAIVIFIILWIYEILTEKPPVPEQYFYHGKGQNPEENLHDFMGNGDDNQLL